jgi:hypothetical protein
MNIFRILVKCYLYKTGLLLKLIPETVSSKKKVFLLLLHPFLHRTLDPESGMKKFWDPGLNVPDLQQCYDLHKQTPV